MKLSNLSIILIFGCTMSLNLLASAPAMNVGYVKQSYSGHHQGHGHQESHAHIDW